MRRIFVALVAVAFALATAMFMVPRPARAGDLRPIDLGLIQYAHAAGPISSEAYDINDYGQVTGYSHTWPNQNWRRAMIWQPTSRLATSGTLHETSTIPGVMHWSSSPSPINNRGQFFVYHQHLFTPQTPNTLVGTVSQVAGGLPNSFGQMPGSQNGLPTRIEPDGTVTELGSLGPAGVGYSAFVNDYGQVTGVSDSRFFLWTPQMPGGANGQMIDLGMAVIRRHELVGLTERGAVGITFDFGSWVLPNQPSSLVWQPDIPNGSTGQLLDLASTLSQPVVYLLDLNDSGQLLVAYFEWDGNSRGFYLLTPNAAGQYDQFRLDTYELTLPDGTMFGGLTPSKMNNVGWVVGSGRWSFDGGLTWETRATLLPIPEPGTSCAVALLSVLMMRQLPRRLPKEHSNALAVPVRSQHR